MMFMLAVYGMLGIFGIYRMVKRPETPDSTGDLIQVAPVTTPVAAAVIAEEQWEDEATDKDL